LCLQESLTAKGCTYRAFACLRGWSHAVGGKHPSGAENDHSERSRAPPVLPESGYAIAALKPDPKDAEEHERRTEHQADAFHGDSLALSRH
jgi:hypothetical protein